MAGWKKRREKRRRLRLARQGDPDPFDSQRPFRPMKSLVRWSERVEKFVAPDGTVHRHRAALWKNDLYAVAVYHEPDSITHVTIQRLDGIPARDWRHLQQIKNETCGPEREAVELYPLSRGSWT